MWCRPSTSRTGRSERHLDTAWVPVRAGCVAFRHVCSQQRLHCLGSQTRPCNPTARRNVWLTSEQHLDLNFNPASLLSIGDALAFLETVQSAFIRPAVPGLRSVHCSSTAMPALTGARHMRR